MKSIQDKAATLIEALPYLQRFAGEILVVKYGGHAMSNLESAQSFARDLVLLQSIGLKVVVVHGGGPQIKRMLSNLSMDSHFFNGYRVTDEQTMKIVRMVLTGEVNQEIVSRISQEGGQAIGLSGSDAKLLQGRKVTVDGQDVGRVGIIENVNTDHIDYLLKGGFIPVIAPVAIAEDGQGLNVNADLAAGVIASQLGARKLLLMTDVEGVKDVGGQVISTLARDRVQSLIDEKVLTGGMLPKLKCACDALAQGVKKVHIVDGRIRHAILLELFTDQGIGTEVV
ncbi:MAG: acetylglutamate kinase [Bradymonadia bacterium]